MLQLQPIYALLTRCSCQRQSYSQLWALFCLVLVAVVDESAAGEAPVTQKTVDILSIYVENTMAVSRATSAVYAGSLASLLARNFAVANGVPLRIIYANATPNSIESDVASAISNNPNTLLVAGPVGDEMLLKALPALRSSGLISFAPITGSSQVRGWNPNLYFLRPEPAAELLALIRYAVNQLRVLRLGFMYLQG
ncbi:adenylyl cyclase, partial [Trypanosoma grayi]|uniref:adenylyl cyclase n=1 Tax=Trypanosoma grayi TaxID=71804 RepID=UPI0004F49398